MHLGSELSFFLFVWTLTASDLHSGECKFPQVAVLHTACDQRHRDIPLHPTNITCSRAKQLGPHSLIL
jgi:hypothetical protein